jgi:multidrug resistance efflux pump
MKKKIILTTVLVLLLGGGGSAGAYYYNQSSKYISTEDAKVQGDLRAIYPPAAGKLIDWRFQEGDSFQKGEVLGLVETSPAKGNTPATTVEVLAPEGGTIIQTVTIKDQYVSPTGSLALSADLGSLYVTANLQETEVTEAKVGAKVTIKIDAFKEKAFTGHIEKIGLGTNSSFSLISSSNASGNYTKVIQRIPVKIKLEDYKGTRLIPGLNATVKIEK